MQKYQLGLIFFVLVVLASACSDQDNSPSIQLPNQPGGNEDQWAVPINEVLRGASRDAIPAIDDPIFEPAQTNTFAEENDLVIGIKIGEEARAYPHYIMDWHEIVNDQFGEEYIALTYCPLTGTAIGWNREIDGVVNNFGVSGFLYNSNLMPYDRVTNSTWSQMRLNCVNGELFNREIETIQVIETTWKTWKEMFPNSQILSVNTGFVRNYSSTAYPGYSTDPGLIFPVNNSNNALSNKDRVLGVVVNNFAKAYPISELDDTQTTVIQETLGGKDIVVVGNKQKNYIIGYEANFNGTTLEFSPIQNPTGSEIMIDNLGNQWDIFGEATSGPNSGEQLNMLTEAYIGYWFSWAAFHPEVDLYLR